MALVQYPETTPSRRFSSHMQKPKKVGKLAKSLVKILQKHSGRSHGQMMVRHQGGRHKRYYRLIDFKRNKFDVFGKVVAMENDPNRNVDIALVHYADGDKRYMLRPNGLKVGDEVVAGKKVENKVGNATQLKNLPIGTILHNVEMTPGKGGQLGRGAGTSLTIQAKEGGYAHLKLPSGELRMISLECMGTIGSLGNEEHKNMKLGKAGRSRHLGIRPAVRGTAMDPDSHPHGGGEGRSGVGRKKPMTKYGRPAVGNTRKKGKWTGKYIIKGRRG